MRAKIPERIVWAVEVLDVQPDDLILEIGCGRGCTIGPICSKLTTGHLTAIDRSAKMVETATSSNTRQIATGRVSILHADLLEIDQSDASFDKIFLFNLNVFWMNPVDELRVIRGLLKANGKFYIFHQPPPGHDVSEFAVEFQKNLSVSGFVTDCVLYGELTPVRATCIIASLES